jgi:hypothetical protein
MHLRRCRYRSPTNNDDLFKWSTLEDVENRIEVQGVDEEDSTWPQE